MYGALGCLVVAVVRTDAAAIYATGRTWWECPPVTRVNLTGVLPQGVTGKDVIVALCVFPIDGTIERWLRYKATEAAMFPDRSTNPLAANPDDLYAKQLYLNLGILSPYVSGPNSVKIATPLHGLEPRNMKINKAYPAAAVFKEAAKANGGVVPKVADGAKMYIAAASSREQEAAEDSGDWQVLLDAGAEALVSGCGPCIRVGIGFLEPGEIYPGSMAYESNVSKEAMAKACMMSYDPDFQKVIRPNVILVSGTSFGCGSSPSVIFSPSNSINHGLVGLELPRLIQRLRAAFPKDAKNPIPTFRTGWTLEWDVKKGMVHVQEGEGGEKWTEKVGDIPPNVQEIIALGSLEEWCKHELKKAS
ncbi:aconitase 3-isopropylmalate dehydratase large alpha beta subdomain protein [Fusarium sp. NRRL 25303]|nr:aconitase 3-isopropylmalate dehydratase large alpha beta subdomain protein [Fusarium sp. NRRL 25303]